ncbi:MAG: proton-conducting transporter transmembrane domain-containing protein [Candidatus Dormibacteraceae bacterium]
MTGQILLVVLLAIPLAGAVATWLVRPVAVLHGITAVTHSAVLGVSIVLLARLLNGKAPHAFGNLLLLDPLGGVVLLIVGGVGFTSAVYSIGYLHDELQTGAVRPRELRRYYALLHVFVFTMLLSAVSGNLGVLWTAIAATTIASAPLVDFYGSRDPLEAAWKYIVLTTAGSMVALFGLLVLYQDGVHVLGQTYDFSFPVVAGIASKLPAAGALTAFLLVLIGFGTKAGLAPMHSSVPDAHSQAPSPICALLSGVELNCAILGILRVFALTAPAAGLGHLRLALVLLGLFSLLVGVVFLISQRDFKRLLVYSSIEQMGLIALGVGIGAPLAVFGAMLQMVNHALAKSLMFFATGNVLLRFRTRAMAEVSGLVGTMPATAVLTIVGGLAIAGAPPFSLFVSEFSIIAGATRSNQTIAAAIAALLLVIAFIAIVAPLNRMSFSAPTAVNGVAAEISLVALVPGYLSLAAVILFGVWIPSPLHDLLAGAARLVAP